MAAVPLTLEELIERATDESNCASNEEEAQSVANQVNREIGGSNNAVKLLIQKLQLRQEIITLQTLNVIECCVKNCGVKFHTEIGKYKFINELIKLLSPKYDADITPQSVKDRVVQLMFAWYCGLPDEKKIGEAYKMLKQQGIIKRDPVNPHNMDDVQPREKQDTVFENEENTELLSTLLSSTNPEDLQSANKLIKTMVKEEEQRLERVSKRIQELETVHNNVQLLDDMLINLASDPMAADKEVMNDLYESCLKMRPELFRLASQSAEDKDDAMGEILSASDELTRVIDLYKEKVLLQKITSHAKPYSIPEQSPEADSSSLLDLGFDSFTSSTTPTTTTQDQQQNSNSLLDEQFKMLGLDADTSSQAQPISTQFNLNQQQPNQYATSSMQQQNQPQHPTSQPPPYLQNQHLPPYMQPNPFRAQQNFYSPVPNFPGNQMTHGNQIAPGNQTSHGNQMLNGTTNNSTITNSSIMAPSLSNKSNVNTNSQNKSPQNSKKNVPQKRKDLLDFDVFSEFRTPELLKPNDKETSKPSVETTKDVPSSNDKVDGANQSAINYLIDVTDDTPSLFQMDCTPHQTTATPNIQTTSTPQQTQVPTATPPVSQPSAITNPVPVPSTLNATDSYFVPLEALKADTSPPLTVLDNNNIKTFLIVASDIRGEANKNVIVTILSTISTNTVAVQDFSIQVAVPKAMRVKLQPASSNQLSAFNPILPPSSISQIMLIANPSKENIRLRFKLSYQINGQTHVENSSINNLPIR